MKVFVSGATGFIGERLCLKLADKGYTVHALYRDIDKTLGIQHPNIKLFKGDITDCESVKTAMQGCEQVYHVAAFTDVWAKRVQIIYDLNVLATECILELALNLGVKKLVFTSTAGVMGPSISGMVDERTVRSLDYFMEYELTKAIAEAKVRGYVEKGLECVIVSPTRVYGPGVLNKSNSVTIMIKQFYEGKWRIIPGNGKSIGNYVLVDDVVNGHILAMEKGGSGEKYILGGSNVSYLEFFEEIEKLIGQRRWMIKLPLFMMLAVANLMMLFTKIFGIKPLITPALVRKFNYNWNVSSAKAIKELGYSPTSFEEGAKRTLEWIKERTFNRI
jgi:nucleoside-diphosphate-sugar epimerase